MQVEPISSDAQFRRLTGEVYGEAFPLYKSSVSRKDPVLTLSPCIEVAKFIPMLTPEILASFVSLVTLHSIVEHVFKEELIK